jgi:tetratricopeptide (TPR) repeat protein
MHLQATLGFSLLHTHGGNDATEAALNRALTIAEERGAFLYLMWLQSSLNVFHTRNGDFKNALRNARRTSAVASLTGDSAAVALAHFQLGNSLQFTGDPDGARVELEAALQLRPRSPQTSTIYLGYDHYILASVCLANTLSLQGYPDQAAERAREAVKDAERIDNPLTLSIALRYAILLFLRIGDLQTADEFIEWYISIAQSNSLAPQVAAGRGLMGALAVRRGDAQGGVEMLRNALEKLHAMHNDLMASRFNLSLAEGLAASGRFAESMEVIDGGIRWVEEHGDFVYMPELLRAKGNLLLSIQPTHIDEAEKHFIHSLELCRQQGARSGELRTATDLARLMADRGRR